MREFFEDLRRKSHNYGNQRGGHIYIRGLNAAARYFVDGDILQIELKVDTGSMRFTR
jgi:hypothetical protein